jgi:hypothetical protein
MLLAADRRSSSSSWRRVVRQAQSLPLFLSRTWRSAGVANTDYLAASTACFRQYYDLGVWKRQHYHGIRILKVQTDLELPDLHRAARPWVVETGSAHGGSALTSRTCRGSPGARARSSPRLQPARSPASARQFVLASSGSESRAAGRRAAGADRSS